jgi:hypothetical protein
VRIQRKLREEMKNLKLAEEEPYRVILVKEFNLILGNSVNSKNFWESKIKTLVVEKFGEKSLFEEEKEATHDLRLSLLSFSLLFKKIFHLTGVTLTKKAYRDLLLNLEKTSSHFEFIRKFYF